MPSLYNLSRYCLLSCSLLIIQACNSGVSLSQIVIKGKTMGTQYTIRYQDSLMRDFQTPIDSILLVFNQEVSTYIPDSRISQFNKATTSLTIPQTAPQDLIRNFKLSQLVYGYSGGWFNPTVMPLVRYWKFGPDKQPLVTVDSQIVDSLRKLVNMDALALIESTESVILQKKLSKIELDFSAIAKGDAVDLIGRFLDKKGVHHYMVEIGGELRCRGQQAAELGWIIGINTPQANASQTDAQVLIELNNMSLATSGNYRNFYILNGVKYAHTINPFTGYPEWNRLLSASILAKDCALADALATASMAMGLEKAWAMIEKIDAVEAYFIYSDKQGNMQVKYTSEVANWLKT